MQQDQAPAGGPFDEPGSNHDPASIFPGVVLRPLTRRAHVRVPGATAGRLERLASATRDREETDDEVRVTRAISVLPGGSLPVDMAPHLGGADLDALLGDGESGCAPGRHRHPSALWSLLRSLPGFRSSTPHSWDDAVDDAVDDAERNADDVEDAVDAEPAAEDRAGAEPPQATDDENEDDVTDDDEADEEGDEGEDHLLVPPQRTAPDEPLYRRRRRRSPSPSVRSALQVAARHIEEAADPQAIARIACEEAATLVTADVTAFVLRAVEGPRVLWLHPGGPDASGLWGPATLAALIRVGHPVRRVVEGDPLADGEPTALLTVPVPSGGSLAGALLARRNDDRIFTAGEQDVLGRVARMAGAALRAASRPAAHGPQDDDPATGLPLGRRFTVDVEAALRTSRRRGTPVSVVAVHLDGLARIRTELGEDVAEEVLGALTAELRQVLRVGDLAYRIGPDELALLLPATDAAGLPSVRGRAEALAADFLAGLALPGPRRPLALRTAPVLAADLVPGRSVVDAALKALEVDAQKVRWSPTR